MKLQSIDIKNYRSIDTLNIPIEEVDGGYTYGIVGINEAGKTAILKAIAMFDQFNEFKPTFDDFHGNSDKIEVKFNYEIDKKHTTENFDFQNNKISIGFEILKSNLNNQIFYFSYTDKFSEFKNEEITFQSNPFKSITDKRHKVNFWTSHSKYLLDKEITFTIQNIGQVIEQNIPLKNCFLIAGIKVDDFQKNISNSVERKSYEKLLTKNVNELIRKRWPNQNIEIEFDLTETKINFHIVEKNAPKAQRINQRSDGFRQFLSFLLSIAAESASENLSNTVILLDEPETHLHPQAQLFFLEEIKTLTKSKNNILFYSTHSGFLIDKNCIKRTARVSKDINTHKTEFKFLEKDNYSFARVNYEIFEAEAEGYHNEIYDKLRDRFADGKPNEEMGIRRFDEEFFKQEKKLKKDYPEKGQNNQVTLPTYVRNCIHYPTNKNSNFEKKLDESIKRLISYL